MKRSKKIVWKVRYAMYKQRLWTNKPDNRRKLEPFLPERDNRHHDHPHNNQPEKNRKSFQIILHKNHESENHKDNKCHHTVDLRKKPRRYSETSMIFTKKSSFISRNTTMAILATNNIMRKGIKFLNNSQRCFPLNVARSDFIAISSSVG